MHYISTRNTDIKLKSSEAIKKGLSDDGGLFVPEEFPQITTSEIKTMLTMGYVERANLILKKYLTDFTIKEISDCTNGAYGGNKFSSEKVAPIKKLDDRRYILELWHGPTCAFKDMALQILPHFMTTSMKKTNENKDIVILVATSGDTGKAALEGFKDVAGTKIVVFYPADGVSDIQKLQMMTQEGSNVFVSGINGNFDDAQSGVKKIFTDSDLTELIDKNGYTFSSANSINWGRLVPQIVYYVSAYCDLVAADEVKLGEKINICVPTGNFGNILAAYYARKMGLPVNKFICASNNNNVLTDFIRTGEYNKNRDFYTSISPSMDILISSNLERLLFDISGNDPKRVRSLMDKLKKNGSYTLTKALHKKVTNLFWGGFCDDYFTKVQIWKTYNDNGYTLDTHTAVAVDVYSQYIEETGDNTKTVIASTASPFKFGKEVLSALGTDMPEDTDDFDIFSELSKKSGMEIPKSLEELKNKKVLYDSVVEKEKMFEIIKEFLKLTDINTSDKSAEKLDAIKKSVKTAAEKKQNKDTKSCTSTKKCAAKSTKQQSK